MLLQSQSPPSFSPGALEAGLQVCWAAAGGRGRGAGAPSPGGRGRSRRAASPLPGSFQRGRSRGAPGAPMGTERWGPGTTQGKKKERKREMQADAAQSGAQDGKGSRCSLRAGAVRRLRVAPVLSPTLQGPLPAWRDFSWKGGDPRRSATPQGPDALERKGVRWSALLPENLANFGQILPPGARALAGLGLSPGTFPFTL